MSDTATVEAPQTETTTEVAEVVEEIKPVRAPRVKKNTNTTSEDDTMATRAATIKKMDALEDKIAKSKKVTANYRQQLQELKATLPPAKRGRKLGSTNPPKYVEAYYVELEAQKRGQRGRPSMEVLRHEAKERGVKFTDDTTHAELMSKVKDARAKKLASLKKLAK